jgi:uroporphyrinogen III methyltransferase/synthase
LGKRIVVTRARAQASDLVLTLSDLGAECVECPTIDVVEPDSWQPMDDAIDSINKYQWLIFTSVNGVQFFFNRLFGRGMDVRVLGHLKTAAIGPSTAKRLLDFGITTDILPETYQAESVVKAFTDVPVQGRKVLLPRAKEARAVLPEELRRMGAQVDEIVAYQTLQATEGQSDLLDALRHRNIDMVTFTSSSTVRNFKALLPEQEVQDLTGGVTVACIGPITADTAKSLGFRTDLVADEFTIDGLTTAITRYYST